LGGTKHVLAVFAVFPAKLSAIDISYPAEILDRRRFDEQKNSVALAVLSLFSAVSVVERKNREGGTSAGKRFSASSEIGIPATIS